MMRIRRASWIALVHRDRSFRTKMRVRCRFRDDCAQPVVLFAALNGRGKLVRFVRTFWSRCQPYRLCRSVAVGNSYVL